MRKNITGTAFETTGVVQYALATYWTYMRHGSSGKKQHSIPLDLTAFVFEIILQLFWVHVKCVMCKTIENVKNKHNMKGKYKSPMGCRVDITRLPRVFLYLEWKLYSAEKERQSRRPPLSHQLHPSLSVWQPRVTIRGYLPVTGKNIRLPQCQCNSRDEFR